MNNIYFDIDHLKNMLKTFINRKYNVTISWYSNNLMESKKIYEWKCKILSYNIKQYPEDNMCILKLKIIRIDLLNEEKNIKFIIDYDSEVFFENILNGFPYTIEYVDNDIRYNYTFQKCL